MKHRTVWIGLTAAALLLLGGMPFKRSDVARLAPVEALVVSVEQGRVVLDGGDCQGRGASWEEAWQDLQRGAEGQVFLGTAEQIVLTGSAVELLPQAVNSGALRPAAQVCVCPGPAPDPKQAAAYLSAHKTGVTLQRVQAALQRGESFALPVLMETEGGLRLYAATNR